MNASQTSRETPLLAVDDLRVQFWTGSGLVYAVNGISFEVTAGETLGIVGESGCGKSVTALALLGLLPRAGRVRSGTARLDGRDLLKLRDREMRRLRGRQIAMIFQDPMTSLNPVLTIGRQIREPLETHFGMSRKEAGARAGELLERVGIPSPKARLADYPHQFSGGMRQRAMIAMALACKPKLLIADEAERLSPADTQRDAVDRPDVAHVAVEDEAALDREVLLDVLELDERVGSVRAWLRRAHAVAATRVRSHSSAGTGLKQAILCPGSISTSGGTSWRERSTS